jgi:hypoxanthine phosphoribosyltransferase
MSKSDTKYIDVSYKKFNKLVDKLYQSIVASDWQPDYIVGLTRGGLLPAVILSHKFNCPMYTLTVKLRDHPDTESNLWMAEHALGYFSSENDYDDTEPINYKKRILIVDDIADSGDTLNWIQQDWQSSCMPNHPNWENVWGINVRVAVVFDKETNKSTMPISYRAKTLKKNKCDHWVVFPYEH